MSFLDQEKLVHNVRQNKSTRDIFNPVMTPESIPQFTIPSLDILESNRVFPAKKSISWRSHQWHSQDEETGDWKARRRCSDPVGKKTHGSFSFRDEDLRDPVTRAAMSLPHLPKITTPYGFLTLGESPHVASKESVFFQKGNSLVKSVPMERSSSLQDSLFSEVPGKSVLKSVFPNAENISHVAKYRVTSEQPSTGTSTQNNLLQFHKLNLSRRNSIAVINSSRFVQIKREEWVPPFFTQRSNSVPKITTKKSSRNLFQSILRKHLAKMKQTKSTSFEQ